jgi:hypothetical protein
MTQIRFFIGTDQSFRVRGGLATLKLEVCLSFQRARLGLTTGSTGNATGAHGKRRASKLSIGRDLQGLRSG